MQHAGFVVAGAALTGEAEASTPSRAPPPDLCRSLELPLWLRDDDAKIMAAEGLYYLLFDTSYSQFREKFTRTQVDVTFLVTVSISVYEYNY